MLLFQWNALRVGDRVLVHDDRTPDFELREGVVKIVQTRRRGASEIGVRLDDRVPETLQPWRHAVHLVPIDPRFPCWRCDAHAASDGAAQPVGDSQRADS